MPTAIRDGVGLRYERADGAKVPIVLVHGWCCDHAYFAPQFEHFAALGHTVVAVDLRGHGESDKPEQAYSMRVFSDDVAWLAAELGLTKPVVVGHSMGGVAAFDLAVRHEGAASAIVMIDSPVTRPEASRARMPAFLEALKGAEYRAAISAYVEKALFLPTDDPARRAWILSRMPLTARHVMVAALEGLRDFDPDIAAGRDIAPSLYISADDKPLSDLARLAGLVPAMQFGQTVGSGHFCQLEVPDQVNAMLSRFLKVAGLA